MCHGSHVPCHVSCVTFCCKKNEKRKKIYIITKTIKENIMKKTTFFLIGQSDEGIWWRVCYQQGYPSSSTEITSVGDS